MVIERATMADCEHDNLADTYGRVTLDMLLAGRGVPWVRYDPDIRKTEVPLTIQKDGRMTDKDGKESMKDDENVMETSDGMVRVDEDIVSEQAPIEYVNWKDFAHKPCRTWAEVKRNGWVAKRVLMTQEEGVKRFGKKFYDVPLSHSPEGIKDDDMGDYKPILAMAEIWEIWDVRKREALWICREYKVDVLDRKKDPLKLQGFFPCPEPAFGTLSNKSLIPAPDYRHIRAIAEELDRITSKISDLQEQLRLRGIYDETMDSLGSLLEQGVTDNEMIGVPNMQAYIDAGSSGSRLAGVVQWMPIDMIAEVMQSLYVARDQAKNTLYEVSGISDLLRGQVDPREKLGQSRIKGQFATIRLDKRRRTLDRTIRDSLRIKAEIIAEHFDPMTLREMSGFDYLPEIVKLNEQEQEYKAIMPMYQAQANAAAQQGQQFPPPPERPPATPDQIWQQIVDLLKSDKMRSFRIDIETDSTVELDAADMQQQRVDFLQSVGQFMERSLPVVQAAPQAAGVIGEMLMFVVRGFKAGRATESSFEEFVDKLKESTEAPQEQGPTPEEQAAQAEQQMAQTQMQMEQQKLQMEIQELQMELQGRAQELELQRQENESDLQYKQRLAMLKQQQQQADLQNQERRLQLKQSEKTMQ